ncbi:MAG TPA: hypothetical protein VGI31_11455 [Streptosporangiaceae bacterium]|jgi:hypothetical protein
MTRRLNTPTSATQARGRAARWLAGLAEAAGRRWFAADDRAAIGHGWQITARRGGLARSYRDPRFDSLLACPRCSGGRGQEPCDLCDGTGRVDSRVKGRAG